MGENENIVYDIVSQEVKTNLPVNSEKEGFNFEFVGFTADDYHSGRKPYVFYATMTEKKKKSLIDQLIAVEKDKDDKKVNFNWVGIIWHFDLYVSEWERYEEEGIWLPGRIYFVKADNDEELITPSNFNEKTKSLKQVQKVNQRTQSDIVNDAIATLQQAWKIIDSIKSKNN